MYREWVCCATCGIMRRVFLLAAAFLITMLCACSEGTPKEENTLSVDDKSAMGQQEDELKSEQGGSQVDSASGLVSGGDFSHVYCCQGVVAAVNFERAALTLEVAQDPFGNEQASQSLEFDISRLVSEANGEAMKDLLQVGSTIELEFLRSAEGYPHIAMNVNS